MRANPQKTADLVTFTEETFGKLHFCAVCISPVSVRIPLEYY